MTLQKRWDRQTKIRASALPGANTFQIPEKAALYFISACDPVPYDVQQTLESEQEPIKFA